MRRLIGSLAIATLCIATMLAQQVVPPQTARQALLEMFFGKASGTFAKHLPAATRAALEKSGALANLQQYSVMMSQMQMQGQNLETFESGSILLSTENKKTGDKFEITVENDSLRGDEDDLELSFQAYKNGQTLRTGVVPRVTFSMKQEGQVWTLNEISFTIRLPLADPDFLKAMTEKMTLPANTTTTIVAHPVPAIQSTGNDASVVSAMHSILTAEVTYAASYPSVGYTCTLSDLDGFGGGQPNEHQAMLINSGLASGKKYGFVFTLSACSGTPATRFHLSAVPNANTFVRRVFCADQSGVIRSSDDGNPATCFASGTVLP